jgi:glutamyl-tRNA synthetase
VRIAPSPSGYLHVGTARTAIFNFLYARHFGGKFVIRVEDTDAERSDPKLVTAILDSLKWLGIESDEEIIYQSQRDGLYKNYAQEILENGHGYRCFCTPEELDAERKKAMQEKRPPRYSRKCMKLSDSEIKAKIDSGMKYATRLKIPEGETDYNDMVSGEIKRQNTEIEDFIIARSDGSATYNLAVVVDDHDMKISHVIRGNDHITNTFKQIHIYRALGWNQPEFGHVTLLLRPDKRKVSKRLGDKDVAEYATEGILPEAMFNYLCLLGWSPKSDKEIYTPEQLIAIFNPANFNTSNAVFDEEKLIAFNKQHIMMKNAREILDFIKDLDEEKLEQHYAHAENDQLSSILLTLHAIKTENESGNKEHSLRVVDSLKERARTLLDFATLGGYFFTEKLVYDKTAAEKQFTPQNAELINELADRFSQLEPFDKESAERSLSDLADAKGIKRGQLIHPTRLAVSGMTVGPGLYDILEILGKEKTVSRIRKAVDYIKTHS